MSRSKVSSGAMARPRCRSAGVASRGSRAAVAGTSGAGAEVGQEGLLGIRSQGKRSTTRLLDAEFPKFRQLLPTEHTSVASIGVAELTEANKRVALVADLVRGKSVADAQAILAYSTRAAALPALIARYAARLEDRVRDAPYNWFNFYDFWERGDDGVDPSANEAGTVRAVDPPQAGVGGDRAVRAAAVLGPGATGGD